MQLHLFGIEVQDIDTSIAFYTEKLGFILQTLKTASEDGKYFWVI